MGIHEEPRREIVDSNRWYVLAHDEEGYFLVSIRNGPIARFPDTDEGGDEAWHRYKVLSADANRAERTTSIPKLLFGAVIVLAIAWAIAGIFANFEFFSGSLNQTWFRWAQATDQMLYHFLIATTAVLVGWWAYRRLSESSQRG